MRRLALGRDRSAGNHCTGLAPPKTEAAQQPLALPNAEGVYRIGQGVSPPALMYKVDPALTDLARAAKVSGTVLIAVVVNVDGTVGEVKVLRSLGYGLDENAVEAVKQWKFKPGTKDGQPVPVYAQVEVNFRTR